MSQWINAYLAYDDDTLTALANAGLLRRAQKDVDAGKLQWLEQGTDSGSLESDGQRVQLNAKGPQQASCDCPAPGICKHILAAALWLRVQAATESIVNKPSHATTATAPAASNAGIATPADAEVAADATPALPEALPDTPPAASGPALDPLAEVLALDASSLFKAAGVAAVRSAATTPLGGIEWSQQGGSLVMELADLGQTCRWVAGAGFAGMVSEVPARERKAVHLMALAAVRAALGQPLAWPEGMAPALEINPGEQGLQSSELAFLAQVQSTLHELLTGGLAHVSALTSSRLLALNMSARGEGLPRLAAQLRNLGGVINLLVKRDHQAQERDALAHLSQLQALCDALQHAKGDLLQALRGRLRRDFDEAAALELLPLGAHWWQTTGGARGLTLAFWDTQNQRLLQSALARPDGSDSAFSRHSAWSAHSLWPGTGSAQRVCESPLQLTQPRLADDLRLAIGGITRAQALAPWADDNPRLATLGCDDWQQLSEQLRAATGLTAEPLDMVLLRPAATQPPKLDEVRQCLDWLVQDSAGRWLCLSIPVSDANEQRMETLQRLAARKASVHGVLVRVERSLAQCQWIPVAVLSSNAKHQVQSISLDFDSEVKRSTPIGQRILQLLKLRREALQPPPTGAATLTQRLLTPVLDVLETQAATGRMRLTTLQIEALQAALPPLNSVGLHTVTQALQNHLSAPSATSTLRLHRLCQWMLELDGLPGTT